jgi:hypothetical protein
LYNQQVMILKRIYMIKQIVIVLFAAISFDVYAQSTVNPQTDTIRWSSSEFTDKNTNVSVDGQFQFLTYGSSKIDWVQKNGKLVYTFSVSKVEGTWADVNADGSITYTIKLNEMTGTLSISRSAGISIDLNLSSVSDKINNRYIVNKFDIR